MDNNHSLELTFRPFQSILRLQERRHIENSRDSDSPVQVQIKIQRNFSPTQQWNTTSYVYARSTVEGLESRQKQRNRVKMYASA